MESAISIYEVSPRDGLQGLRKTIPLRKKIKLVRKLKNAGLNNIEVGSLVHPSVLPMRDSGKLYKITGGDLLVVNQKGFERAKKLGVKHINVVISTSDKFIKQNQNITYTEAKNIYENMAKEIPINRLYISCAFSKDIDESAVLQCVDWGKNLAKYIILCDTESTGDVNKIRSICTQAYNITPNLGVHLHTSKNSIDCIRGAYESGIRLYDSSIGGLGGCIAIDSAKGNIPTEDLVMWAMTNKIPIKNDIQFKQLYTTSKYAINLEYTNTEKMSNWISNKMGLNYP